MRALAPPTPKNTETTKKTTTIFLLAPMRALAPRSVHAKPSAQAPIDTNGGWGGNQKK